MPNLTSVTVTAGVPTAGTGTVSTLDALMADGGQATLGAKADAKSTATDVTAVSAMSVWKQISASVQSLVTNLGIQTIKAASTAPVAADTALVVAISPNGQNANGTATDASSAPVAWSTEGKAQLGSVTETAPATDTASSGLNGRLQRIAQRLTSTIALLPAALGAGGGLKIDGSGTALVVASHAVTNAGTFAVQSAAAGDVAHASPDSGNPVKQGFKATTALSALTLAANANRTDGFAGVDGVQITRPHCNLEDIVTGNATNTDGTATQCIAAQAAGIKTYLTSVVLCNTSATAITVDIKDGSTVKVSLPLPAGSGCVYNPPIPIPGTAATAWNFDGSAAATTVTCSMVGFKSKV